MRWKGLSNGELIARAASEFDVLLTMDKGMPREQDIARHGIALVLIPPPPNSAFAWDRRTP
jgi:hypothetical protein